MKYYYLSDLHLEINGAQPLSAIKPETDGVLLVAGDTTLADYFRQIRTDREAIVGRDRFKAFIDQVEPFKKILFVMGNHEHYRGDIDESYGLLSDELKNYGEKFRLLENEFEFINPGVALWGSSLWTDMNGDNPQDHMYISNYMNDYKVIEKKGNDLTTVDTYNIHKESMTKFKEALSGPLSQAKIVVMSHHAPSFKCNGEEHTNSNAAAGYCSDLSDLILDNPNIVKWVHGHTHTRGAFMLGQCEVLCNCMGYGLRYTESCAREFLAQRFLPYFELE